ncbi:MAG: PhoH family protein [bacterium]
MVTSKISLVETSHLQEFFGHNDSNIKVLERIYKVKISTRGSEFYITGLPSENQEVCVILEKLLNLAKSGYMADEKDIKFIARILKEDKQVNLESIFLKQIEVPRKKGSIRPRSLAQKIYLDSIQEYGVVFGIGPAGTGKTYLAMAMAVASFIKKEVNRIILVRPAVEAGESLGYLPGDLYEKVSPYFRPLYDALYDMIPAERANRLIEKDIIEIAPLAYMRGRTLNDAFIILDEAQNTTPEQMKMFLTRLGFNSKAVVTGDVTQIDLPFNRKSGLLEIQNILVDVEGVKFVYFSEIDIVRHELVQRIICAYQKYYEINNKE